MTENDFSGPREYQATEPFDPNDPPRFGQLIETAKDAFASELRRFFSLRSPDIRAKIREIPSVEKFSHMGTGSAEKSMETVVNLIQSYGDTPDRFPMIAITSASLREKRLGLGHNTSIMGQIPPSIVAANPGPFELSDGWTIQVRTTPLGTSQPAVDSTILFAPVIFSDISNASVEDVVAAWNMQALYTQAFVDPDGRLRVLTGGPCAQGTPNSLEVIGGTPECLEALGLVVGQQATYIDIGNPPKKRMWIAGDTVVNIDVVADDLNVRTELADLVFAFFSFYMERRFFQFLGRSYFDATINPEEWFQVILKGEFSWSGEYVTDRAGGEQKQKVYSVRGSVPVISIDFLNRDLKRGDATWLQAENVKYNENLPSGDYFGVNYLR